VAIVLAGICWPPSITRTVSQVDVDAKTNEVPMLPTLLDGLDLTGVVVTADALHAVRSHAGYLHAHGAHYILTVKPNQPTPHAQLAGLPWAQIPVAYRSTDAGHGRRETRTLKTTAVAKAAGPGGQGLLFPHAEQAVRITRTRTPRAGGKSKRSTETVYAITSLTALQATGGQIAQVVRGHCGIENRPHYVRDVTWDEDRSQVRTGNGPRVMASLRNLAITILRLTGHSNIAAGLRHHAHTPPDHSTPSWPAKPRLCRGPAPVSGQIVVPRGRRSIGRLPADPTLDGLLVEGPSSLFVPAMCGQGWCWEADRDEWASDRGDGRC